MNKPTMAAAQAETTSADTPRRDYTPPRLVVHGSVQALTQGTTSIDGVSGVDETA